MGPQKFRGIGWNSAGAAFNAAPTAPGNGSGGAGSLLSGGESDGLSFKDAQSEIGDALAGRITLGIVNLSILAMIGFYVYTRSIQAGA